MKRVLVTGAAGFIGSHTVDALIDAGAQVLGVDNFRTGRRENLGKAFAAEKFSFIESDILAPGALNSIVREFAPDAIIHLAALVSVQESMNDPEQNFRLNILGSHVVAESARQHRVSRLVFASSAAVYGNPIELPVTEAESRGVPISPYGGAKLASEVLLLSYGEAFGITVRCQRYFNVFGRRQDPRSPYSGVISIFENGFRHGTRLRVYGDGSQTRDFVYVGDVARANLLGATREKLRSGTANICTGVRTSLSDLLGSFRSVYDTSPEIEYFPTRAGDIQHSFGCGRRAAIELGFEATTSVVAGLSQMVSLPLSANLQ